MWPGKYYHPGSFIAHKKHMKQGHENSKDTFWSCKTATKHNSKNTQHSWRRQVNTDVKMLPIIQLAKEFFLV